MVTGLDLSKLFEDKIDNSYSDYVSDAKMQRAFDNAFLRIIENKYRGMDTQKEFDELSELMVFRNCCWCVYVLGRTQLDSW
jgi:hypothetical protein